MHSLCSVNILINFKIKNEIKIGHTCKSKVQLTAVKILFQCLIWPTCRPLGLRPHTLQITRPVPLTGKPVYSTLEGIHQFISNWSPDSSCQLVITFGHSLPRLFNTHVNISFINCSNVYLLKTPLWVHQTVTGYQLNNMHFLKGLAA